MSVYYEPVPNQYDYVSFRLFSISVSDQRMTTRQNRNLFQKVLNRVGAPWGLYPFPVTFDNDLDEAGDRTGVFEKIYQRNYWGSGESLSGPGSGLQRTKIYREELLALLRRHDIKSIFDAPCGDLNWMSDVLKEWPMEYIGGDISESAIEVARGRCPGLDLRKFDICTDPFPDAELWHCRDTLFHLSFADVWLALRNVARSRVRLALITTNKARMLENLDVGTGGFRLLDLERSPISLPPAEEYIEDKRNGAFAQVSGLWRVDAIADRLRTVDADLLPSDRRSFSGKL